MQVRITVKDGTCQDGLHQVGQVFTVGWTTPEGMCVGAWQALSPCVIALLCGGNFPWEKEAGTATIHCPDPQGITFELKRIEE